ncbi:MAG: YraN family protein [Dethiobacteria bacterium]
MNKRKEITGWKKKLGDLGEKLASEYLQDTEGYQILDKNYRCPLGEIDLICRDERHLVFVEIRSSSSASIHMAAESINFRKQKKLRQLAQYYLIKEYSNPPPCRFDVVLLSLDEVKQSAQEIVHLKNAFY